MRGRKDISKDGQATRFTPGKSPNPGGRPKTEREVVDLARANSVAAVEALVAVIKAEASPPASIVAAANSLLDRAFGKPKQVADVKISRDIRELSDDELLAIIGGVRDAGAEDGASEHGSLH